MRPKRTKDKILVVNASSEVKEQLGKILGGIFQLINVAGEDRAIAAAEQEHPCLILTEPTKTNGEKFNFCRRIAREEALSAIPVIVIIERQHIDDMARGFYMGASDYITKPLIAAEVLARVGGQLELASTSMALRDARRREINYAQDAEQALAISYDMPSDDDGERQKILLVDDYPGNLDALTTVLQEFYDVYTASNGKEAIDLALNNEFDLIMLDVVMPEMDGYEVCRHLKEHDQTNDTPVIFLTGKTHIQDEARGLDLGATDYISKPFSLAVVMARVRNHMAEVRYRKKLKSFSYIDGLTNLPNRRQFDEVMQKEWKRAVREGTEISVILIDIDNFKLYNDYYGHVAGDECLRKIGAALGSCRRRATDFVGRYGGEEFVAILPNTDADGALHMTHEMLEAVRGLRIPHEFNPHDGIVTVSLGVATSSPTIEDSPEALVDEADKRLYEAKQAGRNQVKSASSGNRLAG
jgi:two-component system cell cycle response regulator